MKVLSFGEILWDVHPDEKYIGGAPFNFAAHLAKHREESYLLSGLGKDPLGEDALLCMKDFGVLTDFVSLSAEKQTGKCLVTLDENGIPSYDLKQDVAYDYIDCDQVNEDFDVLYFGSLALRSQYNFDSLGKLLEKQNFREVFVDINIRAPFYTDKVVAFCMEHATILKVSDEELPIVADLLSIDRTLGYEAFAKTLKEKYANLRIIVITLGADGAYCLDCKQDKAYRCKSQKVEVVSTVGAGDSFSAAFLHQYGCKKDIQFCLEYAAKIAGFVVQNPDAIPDYNMNDFL